MQPKHLLTIQVIFFTCLAPCGVDARMFVLESEIGNYPPKSIIESTDFINIPKGKRLLVVMPNGHRRELTSIDNGPAIKLLETVKALPWWEGLLETVKSGGGKQTRGPRDFGDEAERIDGSQVRLEGLPIDNGPFCVDNGKLPILTRTTNSNTKPWVIDIKGPEGIHGSAEFAQGKSNAFWPPELKPNMPTGAGVSYELSFPDGTVKKVELRLIAGDTLGDVVTYGNAGCLRQAAIALELRAARRNRRVLD